MTESLKFAYLKGKATELFRPTPGTLCLISGPNCDDENGYVYGEFTILWCNDIFVLYGNDGKWPNLEKWDHISVKPL